MPAPRSTTTTAATRPQRPRMSGGRVAPVEEHGLAGHEVRPRGREKDDEWSDLLEPSGPPHRDVARDALVDPRVAERAPVHVGDEPPRRARDHLHLVALALQAERP